MVKTIFSDFCGFCYMLVDMFGVLWSFLDFREFILDLCVCLLDLCEFIWENCVFCWMCVNLFWEIVCFA